MNSSINPCWPTPQRRTRDRRMVSIWCVVTCIVGAIALGVVAFKVVLG